MLLLIVALWLLFCLKIINFYIFGWNDWVSNGSLLGLFNGSDVIGFLCMSIELNRCDWIPRVCEEKSEGFLVFICFYPNFILSDCTLGVIGPLEGNEN